VVGTQAVEAFENEAFDLVFADLGMSGMSGWEVARSVKDLRPRTTVALVTGWGTQLDPERIMKNGVDLVVGKASTLDGITRAAKEAIGSQPA
jgi:CheY-like chemotaxis protein